MARLAGMFNVLELANEQDGLIRRRQRVLLRQAAENILLREDEFRANYRLSQESYEQLCVDIIPFLRRERQGDISARTKILTALAFYASGDYQTPVGQTLNSSMSQPSVSRAIQEVTNALNAPEILRKFIKFPQNVLERNIVKQGFYDKFGIPGVVGCVDGTHVAIICPKGHEERYYNRKFYHSRNTQVICDSDLRILSVDASFGGACHDSFIWNAHPIKAHLEELNAAGENSWLLGDSGYAQRTCMMTPIDGADEGTPEYHYSQVQKSARSCVERTFGVLKGRWRCLLSARELHYDPITAAKIINACCVLHNICRNARINGPILVGNEAVVEERHQDRRIPANRELGEMLVHANPLQRGREARNRLVRVLWEAHINN